MKATKEPSIRYILTGFTPGLDFRVFTFECVRDDRTRSGFTVKADLALARKHGIRIQELPLLCHALLECCDATVESRDLTFTEQDMQSHHSATQAAQAAAALRKKTVRRPLSPGVGNAWRTLSSESAANSA